MCDTFVALGSATTDGRVVFGKNSDRPFDEHQPIVYIPRQQYPANTSVQCTYLSIPQVEQTNAVLLSKPSWMWGAEMGANECNVVIGNEAVWTKEPTSPPALLGMDLLRLALERSSTAIQAVQIICELLEEHGQGGPCAKNAPNFTYHNSFLIADPKEAWVLETAGQWWIVHQITDGFRNISNGLSIRSEYSIARDGLVDHAIDKGYCEDSHDFDFAKCFSTGLFQEPTRYSREGWGRYLLQTHDGKISLPIMMTILRDHKGGICMHGGFRTTASQVSYVLKKQSIHWFTGSPHPCVSFFKPFVVLPQENHKTIDIWDQRDQFDPTINKNGIQELNVLENELIQKIQEWVKTGEWSAIEIQALTREALDHELSLFSL